jgi:hypothetical protein
MELEKAAFMGRITAGVTHEIKNVLAIIKESAGLMEDLFELSKDHAPPPREKYLRTLTRITEQVRRGVDLAANLNEFAHTSDERVAGVDLNQAVAQTALLSQRLARLKGITLVAESCQKTVPMSTDPLAFQMLLFHAVEFIMGLVDEGSVITLKPTCNHGNRVLISADARPNESLKTSNLAESPLWEIIQANAAELNMTVETGGPPPWISIG